MSRIFHARSHFFSCLSLVMAAFTPSVVPDQVGDQVVYLVFPGKATHRVILMLVDPLCQLGGHADIEGAVALAGEDVDVVLFLRHEPVYV